MDAPLDEANVGRFNKMLAEMCGQTQFIVVTHNRKTMEMGSVLYGVTMQEPGVSKLVSVKWEEAAAAAPNQLLPPATPPSSLDSECDDHARPASGYGWHGRILRRLRRRTRTPVQASHC